MKLILITILSLTSSYIVASDNAKFCFSPVKEANAYEVMVNSSKKYTLSDSVQICINGEYLKNTNTIEIHKNKKHFQTLKVNFIPNHSTVACVNYNQKQHKWFSSFTAIDEEHCEFNKKL